jgi:protein-S-isoprenylcysteine O-methyltransferase Ste14
VLGASEQHTPSTVDAPAPDRAGAIGPPPLLYAGPLLVGLLLQRVAPAPLLPPALGQPLGAALIGAASATHVWFVLTMQRAQTPIDVRKPTTRLITGGPFRYSRNPSYLAFAADYVGIALLANSRWPLVFLPVALAAIQKGVVEREERYLARKFGAAYQRYRARVRRWL